MKNETYKNKQDWLDAVMASDLSAASKVFAYGIFKAMFGTKEESFPGTSALEKSTGLSRSKFPTYRKALIEAGFLTAEVKKGRVYHYTLSYMYPEGTTTCTQKVHDMSPEGTTHVPTGDTNTTSNTTIESNKSKTPKSASAPVVLFAVEDIPSSILNLSPSFEEIVTPLLSEASFSLPQTGDAPPVEKKHRTVKDEEIAHTRRQKALVDMGIDLDGDW